MFLLEIEVTSFLPIIQVISFILLISSLVCGILSIKKFPKLTLVIAPALTYIVHAIIFYSFVLYSSFFAETPLDDMIINGWSSGVRLHQAILVLGYFVAILIWGKGWSKKWIQ